MSKEELHMEPREVKEFNRYEIILFDKGYRVNDLGEVINPKGDKIMCSKHSKGYRCIGHRINGGKTNIPVHRLQAYIKFGNKIYTKGLVVRHLDGDKLNNSYKNIELGTYSDNRMDMPEEDRKRLAQLAADTQKIYDHNDVYKFYCENPSYKAIMNHFGIKSKSTLSNILKKMEKSDEPYAHRKGKNVVTEEIKGDIYQYTKTHTVQQAMEHFGLGRTTIKRYKIK